MDRKTPLILQSLVISFLDYDQSKVVSVMARSRVPYCRYFPSSKIPPHSTPLISRMVGLNIRHHSDKIALKVLELWSQTSIKRNHLAIVWHKQCIWTWLLVVQRDEVNANVRFWERSFHFLYAYFSVCCIIPLQKWLFTITLTMKQAKLFRFLFLFVVVVVI